MKTNVINVVFRLPQTTVAAVFINAGMDAAFCSSDVYYPIIYPLPRDVEYGLEEQPGRWSRCLRNVMLAMLCCPCPWYYTCLLYTSRFV